MTNKEKLQAHNAELQELIGVAEALPDAGSGDDAVDVIAEIANRTITELVSDGVLNIPLYFLQDATLLKKVSLPNCVTAGPRAFENCKNLESIDMPSLEEITGANFANGCTSLLSVSFPKLRKAGLSYQGSTFDDCTSLKIAELPVLEIVESSTFSRCSALEILDFHCVNTISSSSFYRCSALQTLIIRSETVCTLSNTSAFNGTPIASGTGYVYVHKTLADGSDGVAAYQAATNWSTYAAQIRAIEDYPDITGG